MVEYTLTELGHALGPTMAALIDWAELRVGETMYVHRFEAFRYSLGECPNQRRNARAKAVGSP